VDATSKGLGEGGGGQLFYCLSARQHHGGCRRVHRDCQRQRLRLLLQPSPEPLLHVIVPANAKAKIVKCKVAHALMSTHVRARAQQTAQGHVGTRHTSHVTRHTSHITHHTYHLLDALST
jgi:hypothetical protein